MPIDKIKKHKIPIPPLNEQHRIVTKIEELNTHSRRAREALEEVPQLIEQFRQSVLAAAFRGDLTADWRKNNPDVEPASKLLERIRIERRKKWEEAELEKMRAKGKEPKNDKWKEKYKELESIKNFDLPSIPSDWSWVSVEGIGANDEQAVLTGPFGASLGKDDFQSSGIPVITIGCLTNHGIDLKKAMHISQSKSNELERYKLKENDFLFSRMASVGRAGIVEKNHAGSVFNYHIMRLRLDRKWIKSKYFLYYVQGSKSVSDYVKKVNHGATRDGINTSQLCLMPVALPSLNEQQEIVNRLNTYFATLGIIENQYKTIQEDLETLNQSILAKAFRGELVPQDPNDEPAAVLLERIRAEQAKSKPPKKRKKPNKTPTIPGLYHVRGRVEG